MLLYIKDEDADELLWADDGEPIECETDDGNVAVLTLVTSNYDPERSRWEVRYGFVVRDQEDRLWMRTWSSPATEQQDGQERWTYDVKTRPDGRGNTWSSSQWVGFGRAEAFEVTTIKYRTFKEYL